jgi:hypothetical protein
VNVRSSAPAGFPLPAFVAGFNNLFTGRPQQPDYRVGHGGTGSPCRKVGYRSFSEKKCFLLLMNNEIEPVEIPINGVLDLHTFQPREIKNLIPDYLRLCHDQGIREIRIIHGKGTGQLRRTVHAILGKIDMVKSFHLAGEDAGNWGATIVQLKK